MQSCHLQELLFNRKITTKESDAISVKIKNRELWSLLNTRCKHAENTEITEDKPQSMLWQTNMHINMKSE